MSCTSALGTKSEATALWATGAGAALLAHQNKQLSVCTLFTKKKKVKMEREREREAFLLVSRVD